jgi:hypothetical protein
VGASSRGGETSRCAAVSGSNGVKMVVHCTAAAAHTLCIPFTAIT